MSGGFSASGLITGLDSGALIKQLIQIERQPVLRIQRQITAFEAQRDAVRELRTQLTTLRDKAQDFQFGTEFDKFTTLSTDESILTVEAGGSNPAAGSFVLDVTQVASATVATSSAALGVAINPAAALDSSGLSQTISAGNFSINGVSIAVDPAVDTLNGVIAAINGSGAGVTASYDAVTDRVTIANTTPADTSFVNFGATGDTSNFLDVISVSNATQTTGGAGETQVTSVANLGAINSNNILNASSFAGGAVTAGNFSINGISITVDPTVDTLEALLTRINASDAGVTASYDSTNDTIRVVSDNLGSPTVNFTSGTSNFLDITNLTTALQTAGNDAQFTIDGGPVQTRNSNTVSDAISDITLNLLTVGTSSVSVEQDQDGIIEGIREFVDAFNESVQKLEDLLGDDGALENDNSIRTIGTTLKTSIFQQIADPVGNFESFLNIGINRGDTFDASAVFKLEINEEDLKEALTTDRGALEHLFTNAGGTGVVDVVFDFVDGLTNTSGFLYERSRANGSIDDSIKILNDRIEGIDRRLTLREVRLRAQFTRLELMSANLQAQSSSLNGLAGGFGGFF